MNMNNLINWSKLSGLERYDGCVICFAIVRVIFLFRVVLCMLYRGHEVSCSGGVKVFSDQPDLFSVSQALSISGKMHSKVSYYITFACRKR